MISISNTKKKNDEIRKLKVLHTFYEHSEIQNIIIFEYLVKENDQFKLIKDKYRLKDNASIKRFNINFGSTLGKNVKEIIQNQTKLMFPKSIWVSNKNNRFNRFDKNDGNINHVENMDFICPRVQMKTAFDNWCEIIKFEIYNNKLFRDKDDKPFKAFRVKLYGHYTYNFNYNYERLAEVNCFLSEKDINSIKSKTYTHFEPMANGRSGSDINRFKMTDGVHYEKDKYLYMF